MRADTEWEGRRLFLFLDIFAKRLQGFICNLRQCDAVDAMNLINSNFQFLRNSNRQAGIFFHLGRLTNRSTFHILRFYGNGRGKVPIFLQAVAEFVEASGAWHERKKVQKVPKMTLDIIVSP